MTAREYKNFLARLTTRPISYFNLSSYDIVLYPANINLALFLLSDLAIRRVSRLIKPTMIISKNI
jgi:hypothetical protein